MATATSLAAATAPSLDGILLLEAPFARVPYDELRRQLRSQQRLIERDLTYCSSTLNALASSSSTTMEMPSTMPSASRGGDADDSLMGDTSFLSDAGRADDSLMAVVDGGEDTGPTSGAPRGTELERSLDAMLGRLKGLKRKLVTVHDSTESSLTQLEARTEHLETLHQIKSTASPAFDQWCQTRLDRMLVDWMLRQGYSKSAHSLAKSRQIENYVDLNLFADIDRIEASLTGTDGSPSCSAALAWCSENKAALRKSRSTLEFDLRLQEFIELTRTRTATSMRAAIAYSRKHLLPLLGSLERPAGATSSSVTTEKEEHEDRQQQEAIQKAVSRAMGLLACGPGGWAYQDLYSNDRWHTLRAKFRACALQIHSLPPQPILHVALSAGLSSLKLPACYSDDADSSMTPAHLGGKAFGDERSNLLRMAGVSTTSVTSPPTFPPASGLPAAHTSPSIGMALSSLAPAVAHIDRHTSSGNNPHAAKNENCPVCDTNGLGVLAKEVPWSHHANSTLVCAITGKIMDENNPPMALPNGRVYSQSALEALAVNSKDGQSIVCPRTGLPFTLDSLRKVYIS